MKHMSKWIAVLSSLVLVFGLVACAGSQKKEKVGKFKQIHESAPAWVRGCESFFAKKGDKKLCAVGIAEDVPYYSLARDTAIAQGRANLAANMQSMTKMLHERYMSTLGKSQKDGDEYSRTSEAFQNIQMGFKQVTKQKVSGAIVSETWVSNDDAFFALVVLDLGAYKDLIKDMKELSDAERKYIEENAEKFYNKIDDEIEKSGM